MLCFQGKLCLNHQPKYFNTRLRDTCFLGMIKYVIGGIGLITPVYSAPWTVAAFLISLTIGVVFGIFPAYKASKLNPIDALRVQ